MKNLIYLFLLTFILLSCNSPKEEKTKFTVMAWNILHGANDIENGVQNAIAIIKEIDPDIICMVETYGSGKRIADTLGYNFHLIAAEGTALDDKSINLSIYSKYPFGERIDTDHPFYLGGCEVIINGKKIRVFSNWFHYLPWADEPENLGKSVEELLIWERTETKYNMIQKVLPYLEKYAAQTDSIPMILAGDMNTPSHLDWGEETKTIHNGLIVPWYSTKVLEDMGFVDSYRSLNPNSITHPGITWDSKDKRDEHRIDYIYHKGNGLGSIKSDSYMVHFNEPITLNNQKIMYPSDHGIVVTSFEY